MTKETVLLIPSLNPNYKLKKTVLSMIDAGFSRIVVVNDGSDSDHLAPFEELSQLSQLCVIGYEKNEGKGHALKYGFEYILKNMPEAGCVVTADGDGQHLASDCLKTARACLDRNEIVIGCRDFNDPKVPLRNKTGNKISIIAYNLFIGIKLSDTQTGLRAFPLDILPQLLTVAGERFEYETNMFIYMQEHKLPFSEVSIETVYEDDSNEGSHFHVVKDSIRVYKPIIKYGGPKLIIYLCGSVASGVIDLGIFTLLGLFWDSIVGATYVARACSSLFNYLFNRNAVFKEKGSAKKSIVRYYMLVACRVTTSALLVLLFCRLLGAAGLEKTGVKFVVDLVLFFITYKIQREWVFK